MSHKEWVFADKEVAGLLERGAVRKVREKPRRVNSLKVAPKKGVKRY